MRTSGPAWGGILLAFALVHPVPADTAPIAAGCPVTLLVGADHRGELLPCHCPGLDAGSLALRANALKTARAGGRFAVVADAGDFTPLPGDSEEVSPASVVLAALELMQYDAVAPGEAELLRGPAFLAEASARLPLVCANLLIAGAPPQGIPAMRVIERDGCRVAVAGYVDPVLFYTWPEAQAMPPESLLVSDPAEALRPVLEEARAEGLAIILLAHADRASMEDLFAQLPAPDVVVVGHEPEEVPRAQPWHGAILIEPGPRSRTIAQVTFRAVPGAGANAESFRLDVLKQEKRWDARIEEIVRSASGR